MWVRTAAVSVSFTCYAAADAGHVTVPSYILQAVPAGMGSLTVQDQTTYQAFSASGLDNGFEYSYAAFIIPNVPFD
jgi:hypothetical protein